MHIDLNADVGESFGAWRLGDDEAMLQVVTSANVACGFHAGDPLTLKHTCEQAARRGVAIGAQVGYRDLVGFGRRFLDVASDELQADILYQLGALDAMCRAAGTRLSYVRPHGALYHVVATNDGQARALLEALCAYDDSLALLHQAGSLVARRARLRGVRVVAEAFADRAYLPDGRLIPRGREGAVCHDPEEAAARMVRLVRDGVITAVDGTDVRVDVESICTTGDNAGAAALALAVRSALEAEGIEVNAFTKTT
ncbi:MAG: 5-oxoprolinase subunit PxpA [Ornithinimicrobium sp.]|uniref:LamB/YcsF family protein n=1 Tax=Ornithinimicrobium sp. TaxID=1977084 RepID=UPI0026E053AC|nr:5-oxoprolinase subunit PxpA [Ornithinimicrobium sp.]MDO5740143.1 5-oxoprolinase subunit PxpA [Ornithinimicrobium sp.]